MHLINLPDKTSYLKKKTKKIKKFYFKSNFLTYGLESIFENIYISSF